MSTRHKRPRPRFYVATYGENGLDVVFYSTQPDYDAAMDECEKEHKQDYIDSYTGGDVTL